MGPDLLFDTPPIPPRRRDRKRHTPPRPISNGLPPTPKVHMGACFSKVSDLRCIIHDTGVVICTRNGLGCQCQGENVRSCLFHLGIQRLSITDTLHGQLDSPGHARPASTHRRRGGHLQS